MFHTSLNRIELLEISFALDIHFFVNVIFYFPITTITIKDLLYCELFMGNLKGFFSLLYSSVNIVNIVNEIEFNSAAVIRDECAIPWSQPGDFNEQMSYRELRRR